MFCGLEMYSTCIFNFSEHLCNDTRRRLFKRPTNKQTEHLLQYGQKMTIIKLNLCWKKPTVEPKKSTGNWNLRKQVWTLCTDWAAITQNKLAAWKLCRLNASTQPVMWDANHMSYCTLNGYGALGGNAVYHNPFFMTPSEVMQPPVCTMTPHNPAHLWNHKLNIHKRNIGKLLWLWSKCVPHQMELRNRLGNFVFTHVYKLITFCKPFSCW